MAAKGAAQDIGHQNQHFVAVEMAKAVVDLLEVVDVDDGQPLLQLSAGRARVVGRGGRQAFGARMAGKLIVKGLAVEQAGQGVTLAVVEQALVVLVDVEDGGEDFQPVP